MATVTLVGIWINNATTLSSSYNHTSGCTVTGDITREGRVQVYAGGRTRAIVGDGEPETVTITLNTVSAANRLVLEGWVGDLILYRDAYGRMFYGTFFGIQVQMTPGSLGYSNLSLTITEVTHSIVV